MVRDVPHVFSGVVEVDETLGGSWRNRRLAKRVQGRSGAVEPLSKLSLGSCVEVAWCGRKGTNVEADAAAAPRATGASALTGVSGGPSGVSQAFSDRQGSHVNGLEGFWGYLKRRLAAKGGVRRERLPLYLAEYVWRYNHRRLLGPEQVKTLFKLLQS